MIQGAKLHARGDSGSVHLAFMTGVPVVAWFREHVNMKEWIPEGSNHRTLVAPDTQQRDALHGIDTASLLAARQLLQGDKT